MRQLSIPAIILTLVTSAAADSKSGFSQLEFDRFLTAKASSDSRALSEILEKNTGDSAPTLDSNAVRASLSETPPPAVNLITEKVTYEFGYDWKKPLDLAASYLRPAITGVESDPKNPNSVRSLTSWNTDNAQSVTESCNRAKAVKEVLAQYSGSDEFAAGQCSESCTNKGEKAVLTSFEIKSVNSVSSAVVKAGKVSYYEIAANENIAAWPILEGATGYCSCLPTTCLK